MQEACIEGRRGLPLIGGGVKEGEDEREALHREVKEECSPVVSVLSSLSKVRQYCCAESDDSYYDMEASFYLCKLGIFLKTK